MAMRAAALGRSLGSRLSQEGGQASQIILAVEWQRVTALVGQEVLAEPRAELCHAARNLGDPLLSLRAEIGAGAAEASAVAVEHAPLLRAEAFGVGIDLRDPCPEIGIEVNRARMACELGPDLALYRLQSRIGVAAGEVEEGCCDAVELITSTLHGGDGVVEARRARIDGDCSDLRLMRLQSARESWPEMLWRNLFERCEPIGRRPLRLIEGVGIRRSSPGGSRGRAQGFGSHRCTRLRLWQSV
ncbi:hypothetical protein MMMDOFMJ_2677 [Methylobacterium gnaphalii]|nr:hypothetical protein MMMDOFMJ_2677 [Methylobacterium gnaphalii]